MKPSSAAITERPDGVDVSRVEGASDVRSTGASPGPAADELRPTVRARLGRLLGGYTLVEVLGIGGTASVYRGVRADGEAAAVKVLHPFLAEDPRPKKRFLREAYVANKLDDPGVARVLGGGEEDDGTAYLVLELCEGRTLEQHRSAAPSGLAPETVLPWIDQLLTVLARAHRIGIVHRDIKPSNLILAPGGRLRVLDFGIARVTPHEGAPSLVTRSGAVLGTVHFMPPEQALGVSEDIDARSDVWAVGATLFLLLTGKFVHGGRTVSEALVLAATQPAPPIRSVAPSVPRSVAAVVDRALSFDKAARFEDAGDMQKALRSAAEASDPPARASAEAEQTLPDASFPDRTAFVRNPAAGGSRRRGAVVGLAAGTAALSVGVAWLGGLFDGPPGGVGAEHTAPPTRIEQGAPAAPHATMPSSKAAGTPPASSAAMPATASAMAADPPASPVPPSGPPAPSASSSTTSGAGAATSAAPRAPAKSGPPPLPASKPAPPATGGLPPF